MTGRKERCVIARVSFRNEQNYEDHAAVLLSAKWGVIGFVPAGYIVVIADVVHLYVLKKKKSFSSAVCYPKICIHGFKSTQRGEHSDKKVESMEVLLEDEYRAHKETSQRRLFADYRSVKAPLCALYCLCFSDYSLNCVCLSKYSLQYYSNTFLLNLSFSVIWHHFMFTGNNL